MRYSEIVDVEKHFKSAFDITADTGESWKTFISNEKFENNLGQIVNCFTSPVLDKRNSIWIQGTYGTGKSHSLAVIKHLLGDDADQIEDYLPRIGKSQVRNMISSFRQTKRVFSVAIKGICGITDVADMTYVIQQEVVRALAEKNIEITTKSDFQALIQILEKGDLDDFFNALLSRNAELRSYASNKQQLIKVLESGENKVIRIVTDEIKATGLGGFRTQNIVEWLTEVREELTARGIADYLLIIWDEFTSLLGIEQHRAILNTIQDIAELSKKEIVGQAGELTGETEGVYMLIVTHRKLEQTETYKELREDEKRMAKARFVELDYSMQPTTTYHILSGALDRKKPDELNSLIQTNFLNVASVRNVVDKIVEGDSPNAEEIKNKIVSLYPFHPYTSYLATFVSRVVGEAERSIFGFLNNDQYGFKRFIENEVDSPKFLTAEYVWDFFYSTFEEKSAGHFDTITNKFKLAGEILGAKGENHLAVFKTILLLNILYRVTTTDADSSEKSMVNPSTDNIVAAFSGTISETEILSILNDIDESQILHRNPDGIFEVASSALPQKKLLEEKKKIYPGKEDVSKIIEDYSIKCVGKLRNTISRNVAREVEMQVFWGGDKEHLLKTKLDVKFRNTYSLHVALFVFRGETKELDELLGRSETSQANAKEMILSMSKEEQFNNIVFAIANTELGNKRFEAYLDSLAQESVARSLQMDEERNEGEKNAEKWISQWIDEIISSGMADLVFRGDTIHVPFSQCNKYLVETYVGSIFKYGLDGLAVASTAWAHQNSKKAVELILYSMNKSALEQEARNADAAVKALLSFDNSMLFDDRLELVSSDEKIPVVKACIEVRKKIESLKNNSSINLADELRFLTMPQYGYYQNRLFMGTLALALRPYVDRLYRSGNGQRIDKTVMKDVVVDIFDNWENGKFSDKYVVRMSTEEERELTEELNSIFGISGKDGLLETKWAIREKFKNRSKAPLWALKYVGGMSDKYCKFIDMLFRFSKSTDENIDQGFISDLLAGVKTFSVELSNSIMSVESETCLDSFILEELKKVNKDRTSLQAVKAFLAGQMSGDEVFWEEGYVHEQIMYWAIDQNKPTPSTSEYGGDESRGWNGNPYHIENDQLKEEKKAVEEKLLNVKEDAGKLYFVLSSILEKHDYLAREINELI